MSEFTGTVQERAVQIYRKFEGTLTGLNLARMIRYYEFQDGYISVEEMFADPPTDYIWAAFTAS